MIVLMSLYKIIDKEILIFCFIFVLKTVIQISAVYTSHVTRVYVHQ